MKKNVRDLMTGDKISSDIYKGEALIFKTGTIVNPKVRDKLLKWGVTEVEIEGATDSTTDSNSAHTSNQLTSINEKIKNINKARISLNKGMNYTKKLALRELFYKNVERVFTEQRFGYALHDTNTLLTLENLFISIMSDTVIYNAMIALEEWDKDTCLHSFDVFLLGTILAQATKLENIPMFSKGCLLHDIGKLNVPQHILGKKGKLTAHEFEIVRSHTHWGSEWIRNNIGSKTLESLSKSHHERLDGTGYPEGLEKERISNELRILMIVDVYSALTLDRAYRKSIPPSQAIEYLLSNSAQYDFIYLTLLMETLCIYPVNSMVQLSNGKKAKVLYVNENYPCLPLIEEMRSRHTFSLPYDLSITIKKFTQWSAGTKISDRHSHLKDRYIQALLSGEKEEALSILELLSDGMCVEDIYTNIIGKSMEEIGDRWEKGIVTIAEEHIASEVTREIIDIKTREYKRKQESKGKILLSTLGFEKHTLPVKIFSDILEINGWRVYNLENPLPIEDLLNFANKHQIFCIGFSVTMKENIALLQEAIKLIKEKGSKLFVFAGGRAVRAQKVQEVDFQETENVSETFKILDKILQERYAKQQWDDNHL